MRITRDQMFMEMAHVAAKRATCFRGNVGAILVQGKSLLSMGYNGPAAGEAHCQGNSCPLSKSGGCTRSLHAEHNALERGIPHVDRHNLHKVTLYCTHSPCPDCAREIVSSAAVDRVVYTLEYRLHGGIDHLLDYGAEVQQLTAAGYLIDKRTGLLVHGEA